jgi:hypothetical protein
VTLRNVVIKSQAIKCTGIKIMSTKIGLLKKSELPVTAKSKEDKTDTVYVEML